MFGIQMMHPQMCETKKWTLPEKCFAIVDGVDCIVEIRRGEMGYRRTEYKPEIKTLRRLNREFRITDAQYEAMIDGSMFGWDTQAADPLTHQPVETEIELAPSNTVECAKIQTEPSPRRAEESDDIGGAQKVAESIISSLDKVYSREQVYAIAVWMRYLSTQA